MPGDTDMTTREQRSGLGLIPVMAALFVVIVGCGSKEDHVEPMDVAEFRVSEWINQLEAAYRTEGVRGFLFTRDSMRADKSALQDDLDYDTASMVLGLRETEITKKESELTAQLRSLASYIETHPGQARAQQEELEGRLFSYSFGNGPVDYDSVPARLAALYSMIAKEKNE